MNELIRQKALELGFDDCRITTAEPPPHTGEFQQWLKDGHHGTMTWLERNAHKRIRPTEVLPQAKSIIVLATSYQKPSQPDPTEKPVAGDRITGQIARYAQYADYHDILAPKLKALAAFLTELDPGCKSLWYVDTGPLLERDLAQRAGLGFAGKHTNLISRKLGNWFFISEIITTLELTPESSEPNRCGTCTRCITACPTNAITAPFKLDARKCISFLTIELKGSMPIELRPAIGNRIYGCDDCLAACPWNRFAKEASLMAPHRRGDIETPALIELLSLDEAGFKQKFAGTPIIRTKRRGLLRNVCVALGNLRDRSTLPALLKAASDPELLIAEHAVWAMDQFRESPPKKHPL